MNPNSYCLIMAGGIGNRFWPVSNRRCPKQFSDILHCGKSFIRQTYERISQIFPNHRIFIITGEEYEDIIKRQLPEIPVPIYWRNLMSETPPLVSLMPLIKSKVWIRMRISSLSLPTILSATIRLIWTTSRRGYLLSRNKRDCSRSASLLHVPRQNTDTFRVKSKDNTQKISQIRLSPKSPTKNWPICFSIPMSFCGIAGIFIWSVQDIIQEFKTHMFDLHALFNTGM